MKRTRIVRRDNTGKPLREVDGWEAEIYGVRVVVCRISNGRLWECCEPRTGLTISGRVSKTRDEILMVTRESVKQIATAHRRDPGEWLEGLVDEFRGLSTRPSCDAGAGGERRA